MLDRIAANKKLVIYLFGFFTFYIGLSYFSGKAHISPLRERIKLLQAKVQEIKGYYDPLGAQVHYVEKDAKEAEAFYRQHYQALLGKAVFQPGDAYRIPADERSPKNYFRKRVLEFQERLQGYQIPFLPNPLQEPDSKRMEEILLKMALTERVVETLKGAGISNATFSDIQQHSEEVSDYLFIDRLTRYRLQMTTEAPFEKMVKWVDSLKQPGGFLFIEQMTINAAADSRTVRVNLAALQPRLKERLTYAKVLAPEGPGDH
ncbi:MAG: hypothetical protein MPW14_25540 (plasmid) [Candidatus Manganitrophus sp.]|nr:hypothetical protein [Candidatus Manganitrophus sp.]MDC4228364.1 hypothetical protein [Candidatus Manganitrophus sp.]WDT73682.1 MAG: hypothetical protein MPW17_22340 [Candidatus Manganitrophus sp.]WDT77984.1 MAG: hypothetical protein MPW16_21565 [Candidatus Manganitrophus sp.]WDT82755.1 MAG: hypothetical protein MPW14_25540 [Candidatus Manganitrophus sp.]